MSLKKPGKNHFYRCVTIVLIHHALLFVQQVQHSNEKMELLKWTFTAALVVVFVCQLVLMVQGVSIGEIHAQQSKT